MGKQLTSIIDKVYHYTTPEGLIGIITKNCFRATNNFYLNDSEEFMRGIRIACRIIRKTHDSSKGDERGRMDRFQKDLALIGPSHNISTYVCSFSEAGDQLSQWRAYCLGGGFSIGFPRDDLGKAVAEQGFELQECIYDHDHHEKIIKNMVEQVIVPWVENPGPLRTKHPHASDGDIGCGISSEFIWKLHSVCSILKNGSFSDEREWRLVSETGTDWHKKVKFRSRKGLVIPYINIKLPEPKDREFWKRVEVVVGPSLYPEESKASVYKLFRKTHGHAIAIRHTNSSFREL